MYRQYLVKKDRKSERVCVLTEKKIKRKKKFRYRESNPGLLCERQPC